ncbi:MAG: PHP domain-containing protein [Promethearchaeota archaeon]
MHTKYSSCSRKHGEYTLLDAYKTAKSRGYDGIGITDHCNYKGYKAPYYFLREQRKMIEDNNLSDNIKLGLEITIINKKGGLGVNPKYLKLLDFYIISEHCHLSKLFSDFYRLKDKFVKWLREGNKRKVDETIVFLKDLMINGIKKNPNTILAHIWRFSRNRGYHSIKTLEATEEIMDALQHNHVALELHSGLLNSLLLNDIENQNLHESYLKKLSPVFHEEIITPKEYVKKIIKISKKYDVYYSFGSDAHQLKDIGIFGKLKSPNDLLAFLKEVNISKKRIVTPEFFK